MKVNFDELRRIILDRLDGDVDIVEFDKLWDMRTSQNKFAINEWLGEALLNNYLRWLELGATIDK